jgi:hypothetical protein
MQPSQAGPTSSGLQDSCEPSSGYCGVLYLQLTSSGSSGECRPVVWRSAWWNDIENDTLAPVAMRRPTWPAGCARCCWLLG